MPLFQYAFNSGFTKKKLRTVGPHKEVSNSSPLETVYIYININSVSHFETP